MLLPDKPQSLIQVVKTGLSLWKTTLRLTFPLTLIFTFINTSFHIMFSMLLPLHQLSMQDIILLIVYAIGSVIVLMIINIAIIVRVNEALQGNHLDIGDAIYLGFQKVFKSFLIGFLAFCAVAIGSLLLVIPGIILSIYLIFSTYIFIIEEKGVIASIRESFRLVSGNWWRVAGAFLLINLIYLIGSLLVGFMMGGVDFFATIVSTVLFGKVYKVLENDILMMLSSLIAAVLYPLFSTCLIALYYDLRSRKTLASTSASSPTTTP